MDFNDPELTWMSSPPSRPAETLTFDLQNIIRSQIGASEYSLSVLSQLFEPSRGIVVTIFDQTNELVS